MDYILRELERQRLVMELLLAAPTRETAGSGEQPQNEERRSRPGGEFGRAGETDVAEKQRAAEANEAEAIRRTGWPASEREALPAGRSGVRNMQTGEMTLRLSAQEVSRAVERDARRYDGGYRTY